MGTRTLTGASHPLLWDLRFPPRDYSFGYPFRVLRKSQPTWHSSSEQGTMESMCPCWALCWVLGTQGSHSHGFQAVQGERE